MKMTALENCFTTILKQIETVLNVSGGDGSGLIADAVNQP